ncbi:MAG: hypothetical protein HY040_12485 [Planctomycetes bacterium]|nr:hypothetical protein [Planctomycetota bacterium]
MPFNTGILAAGMLATILGGLGSAQTGDKKEPVSKLTTEEWRQDLQHFVSELPKRHANAFHHISKERFEAEVAELKRRLDGMDADEAYVGLWSEYKAGRDPVLEWVLKYEAK